MRNVSSYLVLLLVCSWMFFCSEVDAQEITVTGSWTLYIDSGDLQGGAGSDFNPTYESAVDQIGIEIKGKKTKDWRVDVSKVDSYWDSRLLLYVRRTSDGIGSGSISGGTSYQEVTDVDQEFFRGGKNRKNIDVQLMIDGVTVEIPTDTYTTTVYYTVIGL